jgi:predicted nucleotidyltransferase
MTLRVDLSAEHRQLVLELLALSLPPSVRVWVFGSRATGRARRYSDLDLLIDAGRPLSFDEAGLLREAFEESDLPYRVDIVDWHAISDRFRRLIDAERIALVEAPSSDSTGVPVPGSNSE